MVAMGNSLPHLTFVIHNIEGGIASMNHQIIENAEFNKNFNVHILLWRSLEENAKDFRDSFNNAVDTVEFRFSIFDNHYRTLKRFNRILNKWPGLIVTNDGLELEALRQFGTQSVLFAIIHDFYNLKLAVENLDLVDYFICHTDTFSRALQSNIALKERTAFILHGVRTVKIDLLAGLKSESKLKIVSISRLTERKGVLLFSAIDKLLLERGIEVDWLIIGSGELEIPLRDEWSGKNNIEFYKPDSGAEVYRLAQTGDVFISPSVFEGYGIALLEAMSCGLVPVVHKLPIGVYSNLPPEVGCLVEMGDIGGFVDFIGRLHKDRDLLYRMKEKANELVRSVYDISGTSKKFMEYFTTHSDHQIDRNRRLKKVTKFGLLDRPIIPGFLTRAIRRWRNSKSKL
jgi:glycosyltransferase involved in cell wall biosynthesis